jgi:predicted Zn-dependent protease
MLLGMPRGIAIAVLSLVVIGPAIALYLGTRSSKTGSQASRGQAAKPPEVGPREPPTRPSETSTTVAYLPTMDLDTFASYKETALALSKKDKKTPSQSLKAARAKTMLLAAYRYTAPDLQKKARRILKELGEVEDPEFLKARAIDKMLAGKKKTARTLLKQASGLRKKDPEIPLLSGYLALDSGDLAAAERHFRRVLTTREESAGARYALATTLAIKDASATREERATLLGEALKSSPLHAQARVALLELAPPADPLESEKKLKDLLEKLGEQASPRERSAIARGLSLLALGQGALDKALKILSEATQAQGVEPALLVLDGLTRLQMGDPSTSAARLEAAMKVDPGSTRILEALVRAHLALGQLSLAEEAIGKLLSNRIPATKEKPAAPRDGASMEAMELPSEPRGERPAGEPEPTMQARRSAEEDPRADAPPQKEAGGKVVPFDDQWLNLARGRIAQARGELEEARRLYLSSTSRHHDFTDGHAAFLDLLHEQGQFEGMKTVLELVRARYGGSIPAPLVILEGRMLIGLGRFDAAEKVLRTGSERDPSSNELLLELATCLWRHQKKPEEAFLLLDQVAKRASAMLEGLRLIAEYHWERKERDRAIQRFEDSRKILRSDSLDRAYAEMLLRQPTPANLVKAKQLIEPLLEDANRRDDKAMALHALVALVEGDTKEASKRIRRALSIKPKERGHRMIEARVAAESGDARQALQLYDALLGERPSDLEVLSAKARILCRFRDTKRCITVAQELIRKQPTPEAFLLEGQGHLQERNPAQAMRSFRRAIALDRGHAEAHFMLGRTLFDENSFTAAIGSLRQSLDLAEESSPWWPDLHYFLGMSYLRSKSARLGITHLNRYLSTKGNPENPETSAQKKAAQDAIKRPAE